MVAMKSLSLLFAILTVSLVFYSFQASASASASAPTPSPLTAYKVPEPIDPADPTVVKIGKFAVAEQNRQPGATKLEFVRVVKADILVVGGLNYRLVIAAREAGVKSPANYLSVVRASEGKVLKLLSFKKTTEGLNILL